MKLPAFLYGPYKEVKKSGPRLVAQLRRGVPWAELAGDEMIDTQEAPGMLVLMGPRPLIVGPHFHLFVPAIAMRQAILDRKLPREMWDTLVEPAVATLWGTLSFLAPVHLFFEDRPENQRRMLHAVARFWDELDGEGARYSRGDDEPRRLWELPTMLKYCIANQGLSTEQCIAPLPPGGIRELINQTNARLE
jgi:hypothetical protein